MSRQTHRARPQSAVRFRQTRMGPLGSDVDQAVDTSPFVVAQRARLQQVFGDAADLGVHPAPVASGAVAPVQRVKGKARGKRQKKKLAERAERGDTREVAPSRAERRRRGQEADLRLGVEALNRRERVALAEANRNQQEAVHGPRRRRREQYRAHEARLERAQRNREAQEAIHGPRRQATAEAAALAAVQQEIAAIEAQRLQGDAQRQAPVLPPAPVPALSAADRFAADFPEAVRIRPLDTLEVILGQPNGDQFDGAATFISSTFKKQPRNLTPFEGLPVFHDTKGGGQGGFTIFGVQVGDDRFLIAHGRHRGNAYLIDWSCAGGAHRWAEGQEVGFGIV